MHNKEICIFKRNWAWPWELHNKGVLGINARNLNYLFPGNPRSEYRSVDDKSVTKRICQTCGLPVPQTYAVIRKYGDLKSLPEILDGINNFVIKPGGGSGGRGILVISGRRENFFKTFKGDLLTLEDVKYHISTTLSGLYSLGGQPDHVIIEQRILPHPVFKSMTVAGTPDIRVIVYRCRPLMSMLRLPTIKSQGRANLHQGAVAAGIDMKNGTTLDGVFHNRIISVHPDTLCPLAGIEIPYWELILKTSVILSQQIKLEYIGIDYIIDALSGPMVLEANARPGLAIQIANRTGLEEKILHDADRN